MLPTRKFVLRSSRQSDHTKRETQSAMLWSCRPFIKIILQGTVKGGRRQGRQRKRWENSIREWTGLELAKSQRAVENRENWRKLVVKSSVVRKRPPRLLDRGRYKHNIFFTVS